MYFWNKLLTYLLAYLYDRTFMLTNHKQPGILASVHAYQMKCMQPVDE